MNLLLRRQLAVSGVLEDGAEEGLARPNEILALEDWETNGACVGGCAYVDLCRLA
jgi:hypothetical protein